VDILGLKNVDYVFSGGDRGWKGDVPIVRFNTDKIRRVGWSNKHSAAESIRLSIKSIYDDAVKNKFDWKGAAVS
jgi:UDP-glucose 4-epimerase